MTQQAAGLRIAADLELPVDAVVDTFAVLGKRGSGKTSTAVVMAEEMIGAGHPAVIVDPVGVWWGLRSSADGKGTGLPVVIFGGDHADVPLTEKAGQIIADAVIEGRFPAILDLSLLSKSAMRRFMADFLERLYHRNRDPLHLIVDEADLLAPQRLPAEGLRLFGAMDDIQRRGRARGLGTTLITQRPAVINKDLLSQAEVLIALRLTSTRDAAAIDEWVRLNANEDEARTVKASLAALPVGTAWVWSPSLLGVLAKVEVRHRTTFDSSATPKPGQPRPVAEAFAQVDTAALGASIEALTEEAASASPSALKAKVTQLEKELAQLRGAAPTADPVVVEKLVEKEVRVEVPVFDAEERAMLERLLAELEPRLQSWSDSIAFLHDRLRTVTEAADGRPTPPTQHKARSVAKHDDVVDTLHSDAPQTRAAAPENGTRKLTKAQRLILTALAQQGSRTAKQVALLTSYSHKSGGFRNALSALRAAGYISGSGTTGLDITPAGLAALGAYTPLPVGDDLLEWWKSNHLGKAERAIVDVLRADHPAPVRVEDIAARTGYSASSGGFRNALSRLRSLEVAHNTAPGILQLAAELAIPHQ